MKKWEPEELKLLALNLLKNINFSLQVYLRFSHCFNHSTMYLVLERQRYIIQGPPHYRSLEASGEPKVRTDNNTIRQREKDVGTRNQELLIVSYLTVKATFLSPCSYFYLHRKVKESSVYKIRQQMKKVKGNTKQPGCN